MYFLVAVRYGSLCKSSNPNVNPNPNLPITCAGPQIISALAIVQKWVPYSQRYLFNAIPDTNHNANPTNPNCYSNLRVTLTLLTLILDTVVNKAPTSAG